MGLQALDLVESVPAQDREIGVKDLKTLFHPKPLYDSIITLYCRNKIKQTKKQTGTVIILLQLIDKETSFHWYY